MNPAEENKSTLKPEKDLVVWTAPARPFKRRDKQFYMTTFAIAGIVGLVLFLAEGWMPVLLIISLVFLYYVLSTVQPEDIQYKITNKGIKIANKLTPWEVMVRFWFSKRFDSELLIVQIQTLPGRLEFVINQQVKEQIKKELSNFVAQEEVPPSSLDKLTNWFSKKLPQ
ncbi:hypothetical protein ACFL1Q_00975 [Patescibacteria group bacterium]